MSKPSHSLILRTVSALILMPLVLGALIYGGWPFLFMVGVAIGISLKEWARMARMAPQPFIHAVVGTLYLAVCFAAYVHLRINVADGAGLALILILCIWASDSGAYFSGKAIGGPKMAPKISPNKTWAGLIGGMVSSAAAFVVYALYVGPFLTRMTGTDLSILEGTSVILLAILGASLTISGQIGDLLISWEKRKVGVKDTGNLIPGHGGLLDRIDSLLLASPVFLITMKVLGV